jgi:uncharacterized hydrophobic protein (TIGR00341 family)
MAFKVIEVATPPDRVKAVQSVAEELEVDDLQVAPAPLADGRLTIRLLVGEIDRQGLLDRLQSALGKSDHWRITMLPTDTVIPREDDEKKEANDAQPEAVDEEKKKEEQARASREELYHLVADGVHSDADFLLLVFLSTVVAWVGLAQDSVAILIGAMVIAPLLGPNVAFAFGAAIGDRGLMLTAVKAAAAGLTFSIVVAGALAWVIMPNLDSHELMARTSLDYAGIALALASGAAAALSVTTGLSMTLVGVMVAVALLPPAATLGIMLALGRMDLAIGAAMLLVANIACVNLAAQVVFAVKGVRPRTWSERKNARRAVIVNITTWVALIAVLVAIIALRQAGHG